MRLIEKDVHVDNLLDQFGDLKERVSILENYPIITDVEASDLQIYNVKDYGALGDGSTDDTDAIQSCINDSVAGSVIYFPDVGPYIVDGVIYKESRRYLGTMHMGDQSTLKFKNSATAEAIFIDTNYYNNVTTATHRCTFERLIFDGNRDNNTAGHGIICQGQRTYFLDCEFRQHDEDGIHFTAVTADSTPITENCVGNRIERCRLEYLDDRAIYAPDGSRFTDGYIINCHINDIDGAYAVYIGAGSGWLINGNHLWQIDEEAIRIKNAGHTTIVNNYIEQYGRTGSLGNVNGLWVHGSAITIIANNIIRNHQTEAGNTYYGIFAQGSSAGDGRFVIADNMMNGNAASEIALRIEESAGYDVYATITGNMFYNCDPLASQGATVYPNVTYEGNNWQYDTAAPSSGWWPEGMKVWNYQADVGEQMGWVCVVAGTSGTWRLFGEIRDSSGYRGEGARVTDAGTQTIGTAAWTSVAFDTERYDTATIHDNATNNSRLTCQQAGIYTIKGHVRFAANDTGTRIIRVYLNGATVIAEENYDNLGGSITVRMTIATDYELSVTDYVEIQVYQSSGGDLATAKVNNVSPEFMMWRVS